ncbi:hypothetical protein P3T37_005216 [Kitasatospora sp. MAA4]|uniref:hypothetical protein n=1 Tax=Kitasatospora sp. MAA4 TaxID=3035093 RepID=UPI0024755578|nr:hypothetical protein [Kitasatospora sp. MAA4]MDH6135799.1 hypothetical protein [Kitasatospora sp. MAA4]
MTSRLHTTAYLAAPALLATYGVVRLLDGQHGPGPGWTTGHLALLGSLLMFGVVMHGLYRAAAARGPVAPGVAFGAGLLGLGASLGQVGIDLYVGLRTVDSAGKDRLFEQIQSHPGVLPVFYTVLPLFFYVGLLGLAGVLAVRRLVPFRSPLLVLAATVLMAASLDLMPVGAALLALATAPLVVRRAAPVPVPA